ncbi:MAG: hypothetical protein QOG62_1263 [Thermoleophilaceae bacterium]|jgi:thioester reductase-like protein|nr:hypothetical protein [Thermoleophilaceae bacterium]
MSTVVLTGGTGFLGGVILAQLMEETDHEVTALVRAQDDAGAQARLADVCLRLWGDSTPPRPIRALAADVERPRLGMSETAYAELAESCEKLIHSAAAIGFTQPLAEARAINVEGTARVLDLAHTAREAGAEARLVHVSTAYVAGRRSGVILESELDEGQDFRNTYEQTKVEAEKLVGDSGLGAAIVRPSIIVGESRSGWTSAFNVIYGPIRAFAGGRLKSIPVSGEGLVDLVPVDLVAEACVTACDLPDEGAFHVASGELVVNGETLARMVAEELGVRAVEFQAEGAPDLGDYAPYLNVACRFSTARSAERLGISVPPLEDYLPALLAYATEARWGKRPQARRAVACT